MKDEAAACGLLPARSLIQMGARVGEHGPETPPRGAPSLLAVSLRTFGFRALALVANVVAGIAIARGLGDEGRGAFAAVTIGPSVAGVLFSGGAMRAVSYFQSRSSDDAPRLIGTWFAVAGVLGCVGCLVLQLVLEILLSAQSAETLALARLWSVSLFIALAFQVGSGIMLGDHRFDLFNAIFVSQHAVIAVGTAALWLAGGLTVETALAAAAVGFGAGAVAVCAYALRKHGMSAPSRTLLADTLPYGLMTQGADLGTSTNARLDALIVPALLAAGPVGLYSVASNVSWMIVTVTSALAAIMLPAAARELDGGDVRKIVGSLHLTLGASLLLAAGAAVSAPFLLPLLYGSEFRDSVVALWLLLPGTVLFAGAQILLAGLYARGRPALSLLVQLPTVACTVTGMLLWLPDGGIRGAAAVSSASLAVMFAVAVLLYRRASGVSWRYLAWPDDVWPDALSRLAALRGR